MFLVVNNEVKRFIMKHTLLLLLLTLCRTLLYAQSPTFEEDAAKVAEELKGYSIKNSYASLINYNTTQNASFYIKPNKTYIIYFVYDINPRVVPKFDAHLMDPDNSVVKKYTATPEDVLVKGSAKVAALRFTTPVFKKKKLPVKIDADPAAKIYIYYKQR